MGQARVRRLRWFGQAWSVVRVRVRVRVRVGRVPTLRAREMLGRQTSKIVREPATACPRRGASV